MAHAVPHTIMEAVVDGATPVKAWREYLNFSQADVAGRLGVSQSAYSQQEDSDKLRKSSLEKIAGAMGLALEQLNF
ncbi:helix-turn-helix domain-containing protein [Chromobacterium subtsugae]|uniref:helix-turn-helix domain-containing protein n=1 Tax=Chromobacterium subtsugae TaxID=251747 RepID=UPI00069A09C5|nr:helix-turn-helix transcriptional regulator [Chromobacterium subtsugae]